MEDLMRDTVDFAKAAIAGHRNEPDTIAGNDELDDRLAKQLAYGAIKFSILKCSNDKNVVFDRDSALNFQGDTSVYIQYSFARIQSLLKGEDLQVQEKCLLSLEHPLEWELVKKVLLFNQILTGISKDFNFASLCGYLNDLCQVFSRWYRECSIKSAQGELKNARLFLASVISKILKDGLFILGIDAPERI